MKCLIKMPVAAAAFAILSMSTGRVQAQVLDQIPSDALVVVKVANLQSVSDKVAKFAEAVQLTAVQPDFADPLGKMKEGLKIQEGLDAAGDMAFVMAKPASKDAPPEESFMILMPVSDYKAFIGNFKDAKTDGDITTFTAQGEEGPDAKKPKFVVNRGKYAVIVQNRMLLSAKPAGLKLSAVVAKEAKEKDAFVYANIPALAEMALPELAKARTEATKDIDTEVGAKEDAKQFAGVARAAANQVFNAAEGYLKSATSASFGLHISDDGISGTAMTEFKPDTYAGKMTARFKSTDKPLMAGLPNRKYFAAGGMQNTPDAMSQLVSDTLDPISKELAATEAGKGFASAITSLKKGVVAMKSGAFGYPAPTGPLGADSIMQSVLVVKGDSKVIQESQKQVLAGFSEMLPMMPKEGGTMKYEFSPGGKTVGDLKLDSYSMTMTLPENNPQAAQMEQMMAMVYGPNGMGGTFGAVDAGTFLMVQGGTDKLLSDAVASSKAPADSISMLSQVKLVDGHLPKSRVLAEYLFLDNMITSGVKYAQGFGLPIKLQLPPNLPPIGVAAAAEGSAVRFDGFLPTKLVQSVVSAGLETYMQMQNGGEQPAGNAP